MRRLVKNRYIVPIAVFLVGLLSLLAFGMKRHYQAGKGLTIHSKHTFVATDGSAHLVAEVTKYIRSDGTWKGVQTFYNLDNSVKAVTTQVGLPDRGAAYQIDDDHKVLVMTGPVFHGVHHFTMDQLRQTNGNDFVRVDQVLGYPVAVIRLTHDAENYDELWSSPDLGEYLKNVKATPAGKDIIEADSVTLGEPSADHFTLPNYPEYLGFVKRMVQRMDETGDKERADAWKQVIAAHERAKD